MLFIIDKKKSSKMYVIYFFLKFYHFGYIYDLNNTNINTKLQKTHNMSSEANSRCKHFLAELSGSIRTMSKTNGVKGTDELKVVMPQCDEIFGRYRNIAMSLNVDTGSDRIIKLQDRVKQFKKSRVESLDSLYTRSYKQLLDSSNTIDESIDRLVAEQKKSNQNSQTILEQLLANQRDAMQKKFDQRHEEHNRMVTSLNDRIEAANSSMNERIKIETQRFTDHFEKQLSMKLDALEMTKNATKKASDDLNAAIDQRMAEVTQEITRNNERLKRHKENLDEKLGPIEKNVLELQEEYEHLQKSHLEVGPALEEKWNQMKADYERQFLETEANLNAQIADKKEKIDFLENKNREIKAQIKENELKMKATIEAKQQELENRYQDMINNHDNNLESAKKEIQASLEAKLMRMTDSLNALRKTIANDKDKSNADLEEKERLHGKRIKELKEQHEAEMNKLNDEINQIETTIQQVKDEWRDTRQKINDHFDHEESEAKRQGEKDIRYYNAKIEALRRELEAVIEENRAVIGASDENDEFNEEEDEKRQEMEQRVQNAVNEKMKALKAQHEAELELLRPVPTTPSASGNISARGEGSPQSKETTPNKDLQTPTKDFVNPFKELPTPTKITQSPFKDLPRNTDSNVTSSRVSTSRSQQVSARSQQASARKDVSPPPEVVPATPDTNLDKKRQEFMAVRKSLKMEEAEGLKQLQDTKNNYMEAMNNTLTLRAQLEEAQKNYEVALQKKRDETSGNIKALNEEVVEKEKCILILEEKFSQNEQEVLRKMRQIEHAEQRISELKLKLEHEKAKIVEAIRLEFAPLIVQEQEKSQQISQQLEKLKSDLELNIEFIQNDLCGVEASNQALEDSLRTETKDIVAKARETFTEKLQEQEETVVSELNNDELDHYEDCQMQIEAARKDAEERIKQMEEEFEVIQAKYNKVVDDLNEECMEMLTHISDKKQEIKELMEKPCERCPVLEKNIKKLEKALIKLQIEDRNLVLDEKNKNDLYNTFHMKTKLPPLPPS